MTGKIKWTNGKPSYWIDGKQVSVKRFAKLFYKPVEGGQGESLIGWKPLASDALAVRPSQIKEAREDAIKKGVPTDFLADGRPVFRTRQHRANYLKAYGFFDKSAGYGDPTEGSSGLRQREPDVPISDEVFARIDPQEFAKSILKDMRMI